MEQNYGRRRFIKTASFTGIALGLTGTVSSLYANDKAIDGKRIGIIGLDTSHSVAFTKTLNSPDAGDEFLGYKVVAAYPKGSNDIESSVKRIPGYIEDMKNMGIEITDSIEDLLKKTDVILLETNDGRLHLEQALKVIKASKPLFIDKPVAASLRDAMAIYKAAEQHHIPVFSSSSLRFMDSVQDVVHGKIGKVLGADTYSPASLQPTHPDLFWYGIHGVEILFTVMGVGCKEVVRVHTDGTDIVVGTWEDGRIGTFRGTRTGKHNYGGTVFGEKDNLSLGSFEGYKGLLLQIVAFFQTGNPPVPSAETLEMLAFMEAADESKRNGGSSVSLQMMVQRAAMS